MSLNIKTLKSIDYEDVKGGVFKLEFEGLDRPILVMGSTLDQMLRTGRDYELNELEMIE